MIFILRLHSDVYLTYYPWISHPHNPGGAQMLTLEELQKKNVTASYVGVGGDIHSGDS